MEEGIYRHPSPFSTNIYWREEMVLGPGPPQKKSNRDKGKAESSRGLRSGGVGSSSLTGTSSADTVVEDESQEQGSEPERRSGEGWNRRRYQREDEILWGLEGGDNRRAGTSRSGTAGSGAGSYYVARNPAVNDLHPPVVSTQPTHPSETKWMLQPPPSARIMEGKEKASRSRSGSGVSHKSDSSRKRDDISLGRKVGERLMEEKVKRGEVPPESASASTSMLRLPSRESARSNHLRIGHQHDRDPSISPTSAEPPTPKSLREAHDPYHPSRPHLPTTASSSSNLAVPRPALLPRHSSSSLPSPYSPNPSSRHVDPLERDGRERWSMDI